MFHQINNDWRGDVYHAGATSAHKGGVSILIKDNVDYDKVNEIIDEEGRFLILNIKIEGIDYLLASVYAPTAQKECKIFINRLKT